MDANVAVISPNYNAFSETFIQAHKNIDANVLYYFGGRIPNQLEGYGFIDQNYFTIQKIFLQGKFRILNKGFTYNEHVLSKSLKQRKVDVVLAEYGTTGASLVNVCRSNKIPLVAIFHGADASVNDLIENYKDRYTQLFSYAGKIIAVSKAIAGKLIEIGCPEDKIVYSPCAPDNRFLEIQPTFRERKSFVAIGRFVDKKAPYYTILAIKKVAEKYPDIRLYFGGDGELFYLCENLVRYFKLEKNVHLLGVIKPEKFVQILTNVSGFLQHSITSANGDMEGTPVAVLEASAAGVPVIATRHGGIIDVIKENETGLLVDEHDVDGMVEQIIKLIENPDLRNQLGRNGKENISHNFSMQSHINFISKAVQDSLNFKLTP